MPFMKMHNIVDGVVLTYKLLKETKTDIVTYKVGPIINGGYNFGDNLSLYATASYGYQTGSISNDYISSSFDVDGTYNLFDIGLKYKYNKESKAYFTLGYSHKGWETNEAEVNAFDVIKLNNGGLVKHEFSSDNIYIGAGYKF